MESRWLSEDERNLMIGVGLSGSTGELLKRLAAERERNAELERERDAWMETTAQEHRNAQYYRGLVTLIGEELGDSAYISDDGSKQQGVLCAKVPELVKAALAKNGGTP